MMFALANGEIHASENFGGTETLCDLPQFERGSHCAFRNFLVSSNATMALNNAKPQGPTL